MRRTTVFLDDALLRRAQRVARSEGKSFAALVREAVEAYVAGARAGGAALPSVAGRFASGTTETAERADDYLWREPHS
ncbi:MAG: type II toxin-antitoxin system VapB family antitoxin [Gemmatimonadales bacterium]|nr:type II toxin-antitoxin system VapB family antitoxin [Gemmatimonadales bacterium]NIN48596.1 type II toxin-antitoxin system VapB family antitoxin [Gemmatimonadales bacterium]NIP06060.1 type II toxin-antitoxin system VapB family antitoxin [Gemmatimonadales bacterium]NIQ98617.1 type II toxin-antitoxin system VapB family antitoxin [Gemmatimonadales bacterium]NIS63537.1 type II toxin-antitoxin system VapB family antitoxin [Gemmatimonadales bacterium]